MRRIEAPVQWRKPPDTATPRLSKVTAPILDSTGRVTIEVTRRQGRRWSRRCLRDGLPLRG